MTAAERAAENAGKRARLNLAREVAVRDQWRPIDAGKEVFLQHKPPNELAFSPVLIW